MRNCYLKTDENRKLIASQVVPFEKEPEYLYFEYYGRLEDLDLSSELIITQELLETLNQPEPEPIIYEPNQPYEPTIIDENYLLIQEKELIERRLETISNLYTAKVHIFKEWEEEDPRVISLLNEREQLRLRHDELKALLDEDEEDTNEVLETI